MTKGRAEAYKKKPKKKGGENLKEELNIHYHDVHPEWNYTISPRSISKSTKRGEK